MNKKFNELTKNEYKVLNDLGMLYELFPGATGTWEDDCNDIPKPKLQIPWDLVIISLNRYLEDVKQGKDREDDSHYIYEALLITVYGDDIFDWINEQGRK